MQHHLAPIRAVAPVHAEHLPIRRQANVAGRAQALPGAGVRLALERAEALLRARQQPVEAPEVQTRVPQYAPHRGVLGEHAQRLVLLMQPRDARGSPPGVGLA